MVFTSTDLDVTWEAKPIAHNDLDDYHVPCVFLAPDAKGSWTCRGNEIALAAFLPPAPLIRVTVLGGVMTVAPEPPMGCTLVLLAA